MSRLTLSDIAKKAGVSLATASRVVNDYPYVSDEIRERVLKVINETGFHPHIAAKSLASQRTGILGLVIPRSVHAFFSDPYFPRLTEGIAQACNQLGYTLALFLFYTEEDERKLMPRVTRKGLLDGIIIQSTHIEDEILANVVQGDVPFLVAGRPIALPDVHYIDVDNVAGGYRATAHLLQAGRKRIATVTGALTSGAGVDRLEGYKQALSDRGMPVDSSLIAECDFTEMCAYYAMKKLLLQQPDAVFVASDTMALGALRAIHEAGKKIPEEIAVVGFDDLPPATLASPQLTTIRQPIRRFGISAVETLIDIIETAPGSPRRIVFETELIVRKSCGSGLA